VVKISDRQAGRHLKRIVFFAEDGAAAALVEEKRTTQHVTVKI
jgi:hypothetical protein